MVGRIYPPELQLSKATASDSEAPFLDLHLSISNGFVSSKIYDKRKDFDFDIVNFHFFFFFAGAGMAMFLVLPFTGFYNVTDVNGYRYHRLRKLFQNFIADTMKWFLS